MRLPYGKTCPLTSSGECLGDSCVSYDVIHNGTTQYTDKCRIIKTAFGREKGREYHIHELLTMKTIVCNGFKFCIETLFEKETVDYWTEVRPYGGGVAYSPEVKEEIVYE